MAFQAFREYGAPTFQHAVHIPWEGDILTSGLIFCVSILVLSFYIIIPGLVGKEKIFAFLRVTVSMYIGAVILVSNFAMTWDTAKVQTYTRYSIGANQNVNVTIGVNIGFRGINITLQGQKDQIPGETINYNENFNWQGMQGRSGFGPFAGQFNKQFRAAQLRGIPLPILSVAEYFTIDGEGIRWGRYYRQAGWYSHIVLWLAFPLWILSNILFFVLLRYGAYFLALTGLSMVTSNIIWATMRNSTDLKIQFTHQDILVFSYGAAFWICLITGIFCIGLAVALFFLDKLFPSQAAVFFSVDVLQDSENIIVEDEEEPVAPVMAIKANEDTVDSSSTPDIPEAETEDEDDAEGFYSVPPPPRPKVPSHLAGDTPAVTRFNAQRKSARTSEYRITKRLQRPRRRDPPPRPPVLLEEEDTDGDYQNAPARLPGPSGAIPRVTFGARQFQNPAALSESDETAVTMTGYDRI